MPECSVTTGTGRTVVVCAQKSARLLDLDRLVPQDASSGRLCSGRSEQKDVSTFMGSHSSSLPPRTLLHGLLGGVQGGDPQAPFPLEWFPALVDTSTWLSSLRRLSLMTFACIVPFQYFLHSPTMNHALSGAPPRMKKGRMAADGATLKIGLTFVLR